MDNKKRVILLIITFTSLIVLFIGGLFTVFAYSREPYIVAQKVLYSYTRNSKFSILFILKPNQLYDTPTLFAEEHALIYLSLVDSVVIDYTYRVDNVKTAGVLQIVVLLQHPDGWSKKYLENKINFSDYVSNNIKLNLLDVISYMEDICKQIGIKPTIFNISITSYITSRVYLGSDVGLDNFTHTVTLVIDSIKNRISISGPLIRAPTVEEKVNIYITQTLLGLSIEDLRSYSVLVSSMGAVFTGISVFIWFTTAIKDPLSEFESKYQDIIVSATKIPPLTEKNIVYLSKPEDIVKISRLLEKPIVKYIDRNNNQDNVLYTVFDKESAYIFVTPYGTE